MKTITERIDAAFAPDITFREFRDKITPDTLKERDKARKIWPGVPSYMTAEQFTEFQRRAHGFTIEIITKEIAS